MLYISRNIVANQTKSKFVVLVNFFIYLESSHFKLVHIL